jgi:4-diphosphocytidyl-2-C-methyl-D-erythritol kinase
MYVQRRRTRIEIWTPAKLNLYLEVLGRRADGYHELETLMVPINLFDTLRLTPRNDARISLACHWAAGFNGSSRLGDLPAGEQNLVYRAVSMLRDRAGIQLGVNLELCKRIPSAAGLGGGSSDAAAALLGANLLWNLGWNVDALSEVAAALGSDIPFFLHASPAICRGRGEQIELTEWMGPKDFVVLRPPQGLSTAEVYRHASGFLAEQTARPTVGAASSRNLPAEGFAPSRFRDKTETNPDVSLTKTLGSTRTATNTHPRWPLFNRLQAAAEHIAPWLGQVRHAFGELDVLGHQLSGSGSAYFAVCRDAKHAQRVAGIVRNRMDGQVYCVKALSADPLDYFRASQN